MNEVEKLYSLAGCKKIFCDCTKCKKTDCISKYIDQDTCVTLTYSPFTAKKQIAILQLLTQRCDLTISHFTEWEFIHFDGQEPTQVTGEDFAETFARLINAYWQNLTEEEKQQIKEILE